ncbi:MAG: acetyl-CoA carboxylase biotin carboxyl carrier protein [Pyrinomonadaceae bacterium]
MASASQQGDNTDERRNKVNDPDSQEQSFNMDELRELADLIEERGFTDFEFENEKIRVRMSKKTESVLVQQAQPAPVAAPAPAAQSVPAEASSDADPSSQSDDGLTKITSPIVGTFYTSPAPDKDPYVKEGDKVSAGAVVCIVEAMKLMNEIQAEVSGEVVKIYVENGQPVEYGQPLFGIKQ